MAGYLDDPLLWLPGHTEGRRGDLPALSAGLLMGPQLLKICLCQCLGLILISEQSKSGSPCGKILEASA